MSASIPIPGARHTTRHFDDDIDDDDATQSASSPLLYEYQDADLGISLPTARHMPHARHFHSQPPQDSPPTTGDPYSSRDDIATSWPPRPSVRLVSRSARRWANHHKDAADSGRTSRSRRTTKFEPWDFSEVASATDQVQSAFLRGSARAERPPREGVSGTYFIRRIESKSSVLGVFKPVDEEVGEIDLSPSIQPSIVRSPGFGDNSFSLGPPHGSSASPTDSSTSPSPLSRRELYSYSDRCKGNTPGFSVGEGALKEVAAYLLDHDHFARVPQTALATCMFESDLPEKNKNIASSNGNGNAYSNGDPPVGSNSSSATSASYYVDPLYMPSENTDTDRISKMRTKTGAFQVYVSNVGDADDFGPGVFEKDQVHQVAILDIRTLNHDRHSGNLLVKPAENASVRGTKSSRYDIVPIDHGYILPAVVKSVPWPIWMDWSMIREALSPEVKDYVARLDAVSEARILNDELEGKIREGSLRTLKIATALLQKGVALGLTLYEIGLLIYSPRQCPETRSELQKIVEEAEDAGYARKSHIAQETCSGTNMHVHSDGVPHSSNGDSCMEQPKLGKGGLPYRSMGYLPSLGSDTTENFIDDYIVKYATKKIGELVRSVADRKKTRPIAPAKGSGESPFRTLGRTRSIPNFGIGIRPVNAMLNSLNINNMGAPEAPTPTPACSPVASGRCSRSNSRRTPIEQLEAEMNNMRDNAQPYHFSIDSGISVLPMNSITIPGSSNNNNTGSTKPPTPSIPPSLYPTTMTNNNNNNTGVKSRNIPTGKSKKIIRHRRNASERNVLEKVGSFEDLPPPSIPLLNNNNMNGVETNGKADNNNNNMEGDGKGNKEMVAALFEKGAKMKKNNEKTSPVCPLDSTTLWTSDNSD